MLIQNVFAARPPVIDFATGVWLTDTDGKRYIDGSSGAVVTAIGHGNPAVLAAMADQAGRVGFTHRGAFTSRPAEALASRLCDLTGYAGAWLVNSGSEAVEAAMQFALQYHVERGQPERQWFLAHAQGYHGSTLGALSLSGHSRRIVAGSLSHAFPALPTPHAHRDAPGLPDAEYAARLLAGARAEFEKHPGTLAGIVVEPVGGATLGATVPPDGYLQGLRALCDEFDVLFIADEIMTGLGRTGPVLAVDRWGVRPDIVTIGKGLGAGYTPIAAALVSEELLDTIRDGSGRVLGGHTYAANPLSAAVALAVLDVIDRDAVLSGVQPSAAHLSKGLAALARAHPVIADARGVGLLQALEFSNPDRVPGRVAQQVAAAAMRHGAIVYPTTGGFNDAVLIAPPLIITIEELDSLIGSLDRSLTEVELSAGVTSGTTERSDTAPVL